MEKEKKCIIQITLCLKKTYPVSITFVDCELCNAFNFQKGFRIRHILSGGLGSLGYGST